MSENEQGLRIPPTQTILESARLRIIAVAGIVGAVKLRTWKVGKALGVTIELPDGAIRSGFARWDDSAEVRARNPLHGGVWRIDSGNIHARGMTMREAVEDFALCMARYSREILAEEVCCGDPLTAFAPGTPVLRG